MIDLRVRKGDEPTAEWANAVVDLLQSCAKITAEAPLELIRGYGGTSIRLAGGLGAGIARGIVKTTCLRGSREAVEKGRFEFVRFNETTMKMELTGTEVDFYDDGHISLAIQQASGYIECVTINGKWFYHSTICPAEEAFGG